MGIWSTIKNTFNKKQTATFAFSSGNDIAEWTPKDYEKYAAETYLKNVIAYRCIDEMAKSVASVPWGVYEKTEKGKKKVRVYESDYLELIERPNPEESFTFLMLKWTAFLMMAGNSFLNRIKPLSGPSKDIPKELYILRPDRMTILKSNGFLSGFEYTVDQRKKTWKIDPITRQCDVLQFKTFNPIDDWWGAAVTESVAREVDISNEQTEWNKKLMENEGRPGMIFTVEGKLSPKSFEMMERSLKEKFSGSANAGRNILIEGAKAKVEPYGWSPVDLDFIEGGREVARKICNGYNVPPQLVGIPGDNKYSNYESALLHFYQNPVLFYLNFYKNEINNWIYPRGSKLYYDYVLDNVPALAPLRTTLWDRAQKSNFLTLNEKRTMVGYDEKDGFDVALFPGNMVPVDQLIGNIDDVEKEEEKRLNEALKRLKDKGFSEEEAYEYLGLKE